QVDRGGLALDARVGREDDLVDRLALETGQELAHLQVLGPDAVERRERSEQHVVAAAELARLLQREQVVRLLHDAEDARVTTWIAADAARILLGDVEADATVDDEGLELRERIGEPRDLVDRLLQQEERQSLGRLWPDARQPLEQLDQPRDGLGV